MTLRTPYVPTPITCGGCDNTWTGTSKCHCSACHALFGGIVLFDRHRVNGKCVDPAGILTRDGRPVMRFVGDSWRDAREWDSAGVFPKDAA